ncbi:MAG TPA: hypothetical protein VEP50_02815 [bacterium]|nr:hypothetical protein [bacterium]
MRHGERVEQPGALRTPIPPHDLERSGDSTFLATVLDDEIVLLDLANGRLVLLDPSAARVWQAYHASSTTPDAPVGRRAAGILRRLVRSGVMVRKGDRWASAPVRWV